MNKTIGVSADCDVEFQMSQQNRTNPKLILLIAFILLFEHGLIVGFCNELNKILWFDFALNFSGELVSLILDQRVRYIDQTSQTMIKPKFDGVGRFLEDMARIQVKGR